MTDEIKTTDQCANLNCEKEARQFGIFCSEECNDTATQPKIIEEAPELLQNLITEKALGLLEQDGVTYIDFGQGLYGIKAKFNYTADTRSWKVY